MGEKKRRFKLSAELVDGDHWTILDRPEDVLQMVQAWCEERLTYGGAGESCSIDVVEMIDEEVAALPEI